MIKKALIWGLVLLVVGTSLLVFTANFSIQKAAEGKTFSSVTTIPKNRVGLLLGTAKYYKDGGINLYFKYRIDAAVELYNSNKIDFILVRDRKSTRLNSSHVRISYAVFCLKK